MAFKDIPWDMGNCIGTDPEVWFPEGTNTNRQISQVGRICDRCDIKDQCLEWGITNHEFGWWGGQYFSNREGMKADNEYSGEIQPGGDGNNLSDVWEGSGGEMLPDLGDADGEQAHTAALRACQVGEGEEFE